MSLSMGYLQAITEAAFQTDFRDAPKTTTGRKKNELIPYESTDYHDLETPAGIVLGTHLSAITSCWS